jgi:hypothetical protein
VPKTKTVEALVIEIRGLMLDVTTAESNLNKKRLSAGQRLLELRARIEAGEAGDVSWWDFYEEQLASFRSRKDAEKLMRMATADDPEAAFETERTEAKKRMRKRRAVGANVRSIERANDVEDAVVLTEEDDAEAEEAEVTWRRAFMYRAEEATDDAKRDWVGDGDWSQFEVDAEMVEAAKNVVRAWDELARYLDDLHYHQTRKADATATPISTKRSPSCRSR